MSDKLNEAAAQNLSLQGQIDNLTEQISMVAKVRANASGAVASGEASVPKFKEHCNCFALFCVLLLSKALKCSTDYTQYFMTVLPSRKLLRRMLLAVLASSN